MKDPTAEILTSIASVINSVSYNKKTYPVIEDEMDSVNKPYYIWLKSLEFTESYAQDKFHNDVTLEIEIYQRSTKPKANYTEIENIGSQITVLLTKQRFTMDSFWNTVTPFLISAIRQPKEKEDNVILTRKNYTYNFSVQEK